MEIEELFGLPAHPLVVHVAVVLLPIAALGTVVCATVPRLRRCYAPVTLAVALVATVAVGLAEGTGEALEDEVDETELVEEHAEAGEGVLPWAVGVTVVAAAVAAVPLVQRRRPAAPGRALTVVVAVVALLVGAGAVWSTVDVGHSGAEATWHDRSGQGDGERRRTQGP